MCVLIISLFLSIAVRSPCRVDHLRFAIFGPKKSAGGRKGRPLTCCFPWGSVKESDRKPSDLYPALHIWKCQPAHQKGMISKKVLCFCIRTHFPSYLGKITITTIFWWPTGGNWSRWIHVSVEVDNFEKGNGPFGDTPICHGTTVASLSFVQGHTVDGKIL